MWMALSTAVAFLFRRETPDTSPRPTSERESEIERKRAQPNRGAFHAGVVRYGTVRRRGDCLIFRSKVKGEGLIETLRKT